MRELLMMVALLVLVVVLMAALIALTPGRREHRIGITSLLVWAFWGAGIHLLELLGDPLPRNLWFSWWGPFGVLLVAWAVWDVSRLARVYGTTTLERAADAARGFLHSSPVADSTWTAFANAMPRAAWVKGPDGIMLAINRRYEAEYGAAAVDYVGAHDGHQWGDDIAAEFAGNDETVFRLGEPIIVREAAPHWNDPKRTAMFLKFPVRNRRGAIVGVGGVELIQPTPTEKQE